MKKANHTRTLLYKVRKELPSGRLGWILSCWAIGNALRVLLPGIIGLLVNRIFVQLLWPMGYLLLFPLVWFFAILFLSIGRIGAESLVQDVRRIAKRIAFDHILQAMGRNYLDINPGSQERLLQEVSSNTCTILTKVLPLFVRYLSVFLMASLVMALTIWELLFVILVWAMFFFPLAYWAARRSVSGPDASLPLESSSEVSAATTELVQNYELVASAGTQESEAKRFQGLLDREWSAYRKAQIRSGRWDLIQQVVQILLPVAAASGLIGLRGVSPGALAAVFGTLLVLSYYLGDAGRGILMYIQARRQLKDALDQLAVEEEESPSLSGDSVPDSWNICLSHVSFSYEDSDPIIKDVTLEIREGEKLGVVGYTGCGKTTLMQIIKGLRRPEVGNICIGDIPLAEISKEVLTRNIAEVSQSVPLFNRSVRENLSYGIEDLTDEAIWEVLRSAQLGECISELPEGLDSRVGEDGQRFSGGERAQIAIVRALLRDARIIILDEATEVVDPDSEKALRQGIQNLVQDRTVITIAQRLATLRQMDKIIVMASGEIVGQGSHQELLSENSVYQALWEAEVNPE